MSDFRPTIRPATGADVEILAELGKRTFSETFAAQNDPENMAAYLAEAFGQQKQASELANPNATFFIAEADGLPIGYIMLLAGKAPDCVTTNKPVEVARIYVVKEWLGKGVGDMLMDKAIAWSTESGYGTLWLGVWQKNERAQKFYERRGFSVVGTHFFQLGSDRQTDLLMERPLNKSEDNQITSEAELNNR
jgi:ribosomal protein S18 acetylase RimI-like enzyme